MIPAKSLLLLVLAVQPIPAAKEYFKIKVVDQESGRGVPLVELTTVNNLRYVTDSNGIVAFHEPGLMNQIVYFNIRSHGYKPPKDGFGFTGVRLKATSGGSATVKLKRLNIAERLYRITGGGIYADSVLTGEKVPIQQPLLNAQVFGQDSVMNAVYQGKLYWFWGDTNKPSYPLGNFHAPGATSLLPGQGGLDPEMGVNLDYFADKDGFAKPTAKMPGPGPTWISGTVVLPDPVTGKERMFAHYARIADGMKVYERGLLEWSDDKKEFEKRVQFDMKMPVFPEGHAFKYVDKGQEYVYFCNPYPVVKVQATPDALQDLKQYKAYTCFEQGSRADAPKLDRHISGKLRYGWKTDTVPLTAKLQEKLIKEGKMKPEEGFFRLQEADSGKTIQTHAGSVYWNQYRQRWVMVVCEIFGTSVLGETWYAEADTPVGPWLYARKVVTHDKYSFYNPKQHPLFAKKNGQVIFFEGTYTATFSGNTDPTPRYDYNQIMYKLDLADDRLILPVPVYSGKTPDEKTLFGTRKHQKKNPQLKEIVFFALDRPKPGSIPVLAKKTENGVRLQVGEEKDKSHPDCLFYALPANTEKPPAITVPLYEWIHKDRKQRLYTIDSGKELPGYVKQQQPICLVWRK